MIIQFLNRQSKSDPAFYRQLAKRLLSEAENRLEPLNALSRSFPADRTCEMAVTITLAGPIVMRRINRELRQVDKITDILSFPMLDMREGRLKKPLNDSDLEIGPDGTCRIFLGDLVLSPDRAQDQASEYGHTLERETAFLIMHGLLHLLGYDHRNRRQTDLMKALTEGFLRELDLSRP